MSGLANIERLLQLLTASPQYSAMAADRLAKYAKESIAKSKISVRTGNDVAASSSSSSCPSNQPSASSSTDAISSSSHDANRQIDLIWRISTFLFRKQWDTRVAAALALEKVGLVMELSDLAYCLFGTTKLEGEESDHPGGRGAMVGLLSVDTLNVEVVLRDGETLLASSGEEYCLEDDRINVSREELDRQKLEIIKRLGLEVGEADVQRALEIGGGNDGVNGFGIGDEDLVASNVNAGRSSGRKKRKLGELGLSSAASSAEVKKEKVGGAKAESKEGKAVLPWLAEHYSVHLFDAAWESRHGAALGLMALFKAWRTRTAAAADGPNAIQQGPWLRRWADDVAARCICLLGLDRFGDYSLGSAVAPVRETAGQLFALVLASRTECALIGQALVHLRSLVNNESLWEVRHGGFVGLKYLVAVPNEFVRRSSASLLEIGCQGLNDDMDDVREAAAISVLSVLICRNPPSDPSQLGLESVLSPIFKILASSDGSADSTAVYIPSFLRLASHALDAILAAADPLIALLSTFWAPPKRASNKRKGTDALEGCHLVGALLDRLWAIGTGSEACLRSPALGILSRLLRYWANFKACDKRQRPATHKEVLDRFEASAWNVLKALVQASTNGAVQDLETVWKALVEAMDDDVIRKIAPMLTDDWLIVPPAQAKILSDSKPEGEWGARKRTARVLALLDAGGSVIHVGPKALHTLKSSPWAVVREASALLLRYCMEVEKKKENQQDQGLMKDASEALYVLIEDGLRWGTTAERQIPGYQDLIDTASELGITIKVSGADPTVYDLPKRISPEATDKLKVATNKVGNRLAASAAAAYVLGGAIVDKPGLLIRALMETIKTEDEKERLDFAVEGLVTLIPSLIEEGRSKKAVEKSIGNLCLLACATQDQAAASARTASRDVLKGLVDKLPGEALGKLPMFWEKVAPPITGTGDMTKEREGTAVEDAIRLLMVITPVLQGADLLMARGLFKALVGRATNDNEDRVTNSRLVNLLAAKCLTIIMKRGDIGSIAAELSTLLGSVLRDHDHEEYRWRAAHCLQELVKTLCTMPPIDAISALPHLLPATLATVADYSPEVREPGSDAFRHLVELAPLLEQEDWQATNSNHQEQSIDDAEMLARKSVMRLVLGKAETDHEPFPLPSRLPGLLKGGLVLRPYQWEGVKWLSLLRRAGLHGALCDEMGLGKTVQALMALAIAKCESSSASPSLVLCPASLSGHWFYECRRFFSPDVIETVQYRPGLSKREKQALLKGSKKAHLIVASYDMLRRDAGLLTARAWDHVIFDEVHVLRAGESTALGRAVRKLRAAHRVALTGTPLQNQVHDLWGVFDVLMPGLLGNKKQFDKEFGRPIGRANLRTASADATAEALAKLDRLHAHLLPFILRREKNRVLKDLPPKTVTDLACELVPLQREMYDAHCQTEQAQTVLEGLRALVGSDASMAGSREGLQEQLGARALRLLHYLRLLCVHPALVLDAKTPQAALARESLMSEVDCSGKMVALQNLLFACGVVTEYREPADDEEEEGGEEEEDECEQEEEEEEEVRMDDEVEEEKKKDGKEEAGGEDDADVNVKGMPTVDTDSGSLADMGLHRCLIFAQHRDTLDAIERSVLRRAQWNEGYEIAGAAANKKASSSTGRKKSTNNDDPSSSTRVLRLDGSIPSTQREALVQRFNSDPSIPIMLLTTRVGGLGLNLTGADVVIFMEHDWNPAVDLQAMDRAHRIGQGRPVNIYRLVTKDSVEEQVMALQRRKRALADAVITESNASVANDMERMTSVMDLVGGKGVGGGAAAAGSVFVGGSVLLLNDEGGGASSSGSSSQVLIAPSEEPWDEEQYSSFAVESFMSNVLGT